MGTVIDMMVDKATGYSSWERHGTVLEQALKAHRKAWTLIEQIEYIEEEGDNIAEINRQVNEYHKAFGVDEREWLDENFDCDKEKARLEAELDDEVAEYWKLFSSLSDEEKHAHYEARTIHHGRVRQ